MMRILSPAKINLFLRILRRRTDGYHELASLFQAIDLYDVVHVSIDGEERLTTTDPTLPVDERNLAAKALTLFRNRTALSFRAKIHIEKNIPQQAGLGGGSSNAAATLWALNSLLGAPLTLEELKLLGSEIGSDVPFFFSTGTAYCTGRGEQVESIAPLSFSEKLTIAVPSFGMPTKAVYERLDTLLLQARNPQSGLESWRSGIPICYNDLEIPAFAINPEMHAIKERLSASGFNHVLMSGSGSSFYCIGNGDCSKIENLKCLEVRFTHRTAESWES